ncbi:hypothetical protein N7520_005502 [Penicillium odoratum]|uniref:uncharacterized protein n=1 Tax=Penicillium odoratum TaxID=1167516 RepID=UPI0025469365|nr:uncharacterized protein N7520_005502 [Penicillium odoratum]KAJ5765943.1 hypothetical protein N7520_005502 [Penicillium odoratum]
MATSTSPFPSTRRVVTGHNEEATAIVSRNNTLSTQLRDTGFGFARLWTTEEHPADIVSLQDKALQNPGLAPKGSTFVMFDIPPRSKTALHRTATIDYIVVQKGKVTLGLDDGSRTLLEEGDVMIQQGTMHSWENETDEWTRLISVMIAAQGVIINGKVLPSQY